MKITAKCDVCGRQRPIAADETDWPPGADEVACDTAGIGPGRANYYVCGECVVAASAAEPCYGAA